MTQAKNTNCNYRYFSQTNIVQTNSTSPSSIIGTGNGTKIIRHSDLRISGRFIRDNTVLNNSIADVGITQIAMHCLFDSHGSDNRTSKAI